MFGHLRFFDLHRTCGQPCSSYPLLPFSQECGLCKKIAVDLHLNADLHCLSNPVPYENRSHPFSISLFIHSGRGGLLFIRVLDASSGTILDCGFWPALPVPRPGRDQEARLIRSKPSDPISNGGFHRKRL